MPITLDEKMKEALGVLENTRDVILLTGRAGSGKSTLLRYFWENTRKKLAVLAPTGVAALNVGGETIHSFFSIAPNATPGDLLRKPLPAAKQKLIRKLDAIVIDEISMLRADVMDLIDTRLQATMKNNLPFGGKQVIMVGDLYQLPPVLTNHERDEFLRRYKSHYFFASDVMQRVQLRYIELEKIYRQQDQRFLGVLNRIRDNSATETDLELINNRQVDDLEDFFDNFAIYLATTNKIVDQVNAYKLADLGGKAHNYAAQSAGDFPEHVRPNPDKLELKVGAQVMLLNNKKYEGSEDYEWVNGSLGRVTDIAEASEAGQPDSVIVKLADGKLVEVKPHTWKLERYAYDEQKDEMVKTLKGSYTHYPLKLAWAVTIHKAQGKTFEKAIIDLGWQAFDYGQTYVALSRTTTLEGIALRRQVTLNDIKVDPRIPEFLTSLRDSD